MCEDNSVTNIVPQFQQKMRSCKEMRAIEYFYLVTHS